jgi:hypothetical protein
MPQKWVVPEISTFLDFQKNGISDKNVFLKELFAISPQQNAKSMHGGASLLKSLTYQKTQNI